MITIVRLGHRKERDKRITTHCALVARAFGANKIIISGEEDPGLVESVRKVVGKWGGKFAIELNPYWRQVLKKEKQRGKIVHLTFYGERMGSAVAELKKGKARNLTIVIGAEKVPAEVYQLADYNVSVGNQPHSEVAALAVFLYELLGGRGLYSRRREAKIVISPSKRGKKITRLKTKNA